MFHKNDAPKIFGLREFRAIFLGRAKKNLPKKNCNISRKCSVTRGGSKIFIWGGGDSTLVKFTPVFWRRLFFFEGSHRYIGICYYLPQTNNFLFYFTSIQWHILRILRPAADDFIFYFFGDLLVTLITHYTAGTKIPLPTSAGYSRYASAY